MLAWLRRIIVSLGIGGASYAIMLLFMVLSVIYDRQFEPIITFAFDTGRWIVDTLDSWVAGNRWGQIAVNHLRERVNMTHVVLSIPAIIIVTLSIGYSLEQVPRGDSHRHATYGYRGGERTSDGHSCRRAVYLQCSGAGNLWGASQIRRLDLARIPWTRSVPMATRFPERER